MHSTNNPRRNYLPVGYKGFLTPFLAIGLLERYYASSNGSENPQMGSGYNTVVKPAMPESLRVLLEDPDKNIAVLHALGGLVEFLRSCLLDVSVIPLAKFERLDQAEESQERSLEVGWGFLLTSVLVYDYFLRSLSPSKWTSTDSVPVWLPREM